MDCKQKNYIEVDELSFLVPMKKNMIMIHVFSWLVEVWEWLLKEMEYVVGKPGGLLSGLVMKLVKHSQMVKDTQALRAIGRCLGVVGPVDLMVLALPSHNSQAGGAKHRQLQVIERLDQYLIDQEWVSAWPLSLLEKRTFLLYVCDYLALRTSEIRINIKLILFLKYEDSASYNHSIEDDVQLIVGKWIENSR